jgi:predicted SAM-dependent methyltransferase
MLVAMFKHVTTGSFRAALRSAAKEWRIMRAHRRAIRQAACIKLPCSLHIGCGGNRKPGWVNVDFDGGDLSLDLREPLPFPDGSVQFIYSEHFFEHLSFEEGEAFLRECRRVLVTGGRISIGVPDASLIFKDYADRERWRRTRDRFHPKSCTTPMHSVNYFFRQGGEHKYVYDAETLIEMIQDCGFSQVHRRDWDAALDSERRRDGTLYVDGIR